MRRLLLAAMLGLGMLSEAASAALAGPGLSVAEPRLLAPVQYRRDYAPPRRHYGPPPRRYYRPYPPPRARYAPPPRPYYRAYPPPRARYAPPPPRRHYYR
ncbi:MAG: hypothetical protein AVDCRST_MAG27-4340 [uncultured Craurococcus sp.]|uniref:Uncharacterized protein n=1 Tax=uncultured Craurococcus sp. TaxID=1135998 RepID=A0A6J4JTW1_9PROT|nr:MAG: hypothetical protein AVDCRST_MAG27-4340 [uncultured Craurococcus sp.]